MIIDDAVPEVDAPTPAHALPGGTGLWGSGLSRHIVWEDAMTEATPDAPTLLPEAPLLKIAALDPEDLAILSAHLQDANVRVGDMVYQPDVQRFVLVGARFDWYAAAAGRCERCGTGLHFERVSRVRRAGFDQDPMTELSLLAISYTPTEAPAGTVMLHFADDGAVRLDVECLEAALSDIGPRWICNNPPEREGVPKMAQPV
ncbi:MAG: DUF2948 family protein [Janthinobacterium lividum]